MLLEIGIHDTVCDIAGLEISRYVLFTKSIFERFNFMYRAGFFLVRYRLLMKSTFPNNSHIMRDVADCRIVQLVMLQVLVAVCCGMVFRLHLRIFGYMSDGQTSAADRCGWAQAPPNSAWICESFEKNFVGLELSGTLTLLITQNPTSFSVTGKCSQQKVVRVEW